MQKDTDPEREGVVVRTDKTHIVVWNADDDLVVASGDMIDELDLASWVKYKAFEITDKDGPWKENINKQIYDMEEIEPKRLSAKSYASIKVQGFLKLHRKLKFNSSGFALAQDDILRVVHVPQDEELVRRLEDGLTVEVYVVFMENYMKPSHWVAVCMNVGGSGAAENWKMLTGLPERVEEVAKFPYAHKPSPDDLTKLRKGFSDQQADSKGEVENASSSLPFWTPPEGYKGPVRETKKTISQVLGVVVCHERESTVSVVYTRFGLARVEKNFLTGTWLNMKMYEDDPETPKKERPTAAYKMGTHYLVREWEKIKPPMSTRVVQLNKDEERLLICGIINGEGDGWDNEYLGKVDDEGGIMQQKVQGFAQSYMVEMCVFKSIQSHGGLCWRVVKFHGAAIPNVNSVPLHLSIMPNHPGRTCDDAHAMEVSD